MQARPRSTNFDCTALGPIRWSSRPRGLHANLGRCSNGARGLHIQPLPIRWSGGPRGLHANLDRRSGGARGNVGAVTAAIASAPPNRNTSRHQIYGKN